ncbi:hypothetical protein EVAR_60219_1 [Eumeta japonica]|uniref:Uncharacterized protein n=1 Tax=Eumeta variegata TaxID=151549 RepID=A0A4C1ZCE5_EUMVA|nr:hypothetical protein EVAR_60219_1 [Eumeta japonica]
MWESRWPTSLHRLNPPPSDISFSPGGRQRIGDSFVAASVQGGDNAPVACYAATARFNALPNTCISSVQEHTRRRRLIRFFYGTFVRFPQRLRTCAVTAAAQKYLTTRKISDRKHTCSPTTCVFCAFFINKKRVFGRARAASHERRARLYKLDSSKWLINIDILVAVQYVSYVGDARTMARNSSAVDFFGALSPACARAARSGKAVVLERVSHVRVCCACLIRA